MRPYSIHYISRLRLRLHSPSPHALTVLPTASLLALLVLLSVCASPCSAQTSSALEGAVLVRDNMRSSADDWPLASLVSATSTASSAAPRALRECRLMTTGFEDPWVSAFRVRVHAYRSAPSPAGAAWTTRMIALTV